MTRISTFQARSQYFVGGGAIQQGDGPNEGKIGLSETTLRIWIFFNFFELPSDSFSLFGSFFLQRLLTFTILENSRCQCY